VIRKFVAALLAGGALATAACDKKANPDMPTAEDNASLAKAAAIDTSPDSLVPGDNSALGNADQADNDDDDDEEDVGNGP
jgi:hypothetical protein